MDVRKSRGKFDEIKKEFGINPAPIPSELSPNGGGGGIAMNLGSSSKFA